MPEFCEKEINTRTQVVLCFLHSVGLCLNVDTQVAQKHNSKMEAVAHEFMDLMRQFVTTMNPNHFLSMTQISIPFVNHTNCTWSVTGLKSIHMQASTPDTKRVMLAATLDMSSKVLFLLFILKGKSGQTE